VTGATTPNFSIERWIIHRWNNYNDATTNHLQKYIRRLVHTLVKLMPKFGVVTCFGFRAMSLHKQHNKHRGIRLVLFVLFNAVNISNISISLLCHLVRFIVA
jgi:hypothetical protein